MVALPPSSESSPASEAARIALTDDAVLALLRQHFGGIDSMYLCPNIPGKKELAARAVHARHLPSHERVLALFDDTIFGSGDEGFLVTSQRVCWKNVSGRASMLEWQHVDPDRMYADRRKLVLGTGAIELSGDDSVIDACEQAFHVLAFSARPPASAGKCGKSGVVLADTALAETPVRRISDLPTFRPSRAPSSPSIASPSASSIAPPLESEVVPRSDRSPVSSRRTGSRD